MKKLGTGLIGIVFVGMVFASFAVPAAQAAGSKVNCESVMQELNAGKKPKQVAQDMKISVSSVYRCRRQARAKERKSGASPAAVASPAAMASPAAATH
jgi:hypothetical protein